MTTELRSPRYRFPHTFERPGSLFQVSLALSGLNGSLGVNQRQQEIALDQLDYPIQHFPVDTLIIETRNLDASAKIAGDLLKITDMQPWLNNPNNRILLAETVYGITHYIDQYNQK